MAAGSSETILVICMPETLEFTLRKIAVLIIIAGVIVAGVAYLAINSSHSTGRVLNVNSNVSGMHMTRSVNTKERRRRDMETGSTEEIISVKAGAPSHDDSFMKEEGMLVVPCHSSWR